MLWFIAATLAAHYSMAAAFISAWYHLHGDKANRDTAAQAAAMSLGLLGVDPEAAFRKILEYERLWRGSLREAGIGRSSSPAPVIALLVIGAVVWVLWKAFA